MKKLFIVMLALVAFSCKKEKQESNCSDPVDNRVVGTWAKDSMIEYGNKYYTPYQESYGYVQYIVEVSISQYIEKTHTVSSDQTVKTIPSALECNRINVTGQQGFYYTLIDDNTLKTVGMASGSTYWYHRK